MRLLMMVTAVCLGTLACAPHSAAAMGMLLTSQTARSSAPATAPELAERLRSSDPAVVIAALDDVVVNSVIPEMLVPEVDRLLRQHPSAAVRSAAIEVVSDADNREPLLPALSACLVHANADVRSEAMDVIADTESKVAIDILIAHRASRFADVREEAQDNLELITDKEFTTQAQWQAWWKNARPGFSFD